MISVIIPFYGRATLCGVSLLSLHLQGRTLPVPLSITVVDDCGEEASFISSICSFMGVRYFRLPEHVGVQKARNFGLKHSKPSEHVIFSDSDTIWFDGSLNLLLQRLLVEKDKAYAYGDYHRHGEMEGTFKSKPFDESRLKKEPFISTMSLIRREALPDPVFVEDEERLQDWSLWLRMLRAGYKGTYVSKVLFTTPFYTDSISSRGIEDYERWKDRILNRYT